jgi:NADH-quinone oxidoreductase subunit F
MDMNTALDLLIDKARPLHEFKTFRELGGYETARKAMGMAPADIAAVVKASDLRGRGGAGFPAGVKWGFIPRDSRKPAYLCVNADEGEPGTFKDRHLLTHNPHLLVEGIIITCRAVGIHTAFVYIRGEYALAAARFEAAVADARTAGFLGEGIFGGDFGLEIVIHRGAGAYICGEETALLESLEGKRGMPRLKPPFPAVVGLFGCPTVINNVETLCNIPRVIKDGAQGFQEAGVAGDGGTRLVSVSGAVVRPGLYEVRSGGRLKELIFETAGGLTEGQALKAVIPGGLSAPMLHAGEIDIALDYKSLAAAGSMIGSAAVIVIGDKTSMLDVLVSMTKFYARESCGKCTPCRIGTAWMYKTALRMRSGLGRAEDVDGIVRVASGIRGRTLCPLGDGAAMPVAALAGKFREELLSRIEAAGWKGPGR